MNTLHLGHDARIEISNMDATCGAAVLAAWARVPPAYRHAISTYWQTRTCDGVVHPPRFGVTDEPLSAPGGQPANGRVDDRGFRVTLYGPSLRRDHDAAQDVVGHALARVYGFARSGGESAADDDLPAASAERGRVARGLAEGPEWGFGCLRPPAVTRRHRHQPRSLPSLAGRGRPTALAANR